MRIQLKRGVQPLNQSSFRQVLDCGDGVREVTALALAALKLSKLGVNSGESAFYFNAQGAGSAQALEARRQHSDLAPHT